MSGTPDRQLDLFQWGGRNGPPLFVSARHESSVYDAKRPKFCLSYCVNCVFAGDIFQFHAFRATRRQCRNPAQLTLTRTEYRGCYPQRRSWKRFAFRLSLQASLKRSGPCQLTETVISAESINDPAGEECLSETPFRTFSSFAERSPAVIGCGPGYTSPCYRQIGRDSVWGSWKLLSKAEPLLQFRESNIGGIPTGPADALEVDIAEDMAWRQTGIMARNGRRTGSAKGSGQ